MDRTTDDGGRGVSIDAARAAAAKAAYPDDGVRWDRGHDGWGWAKYAKARIRKPATGNTPARWRNWNDDDSRRAIEETQ
jgi:hypothetical protein